MKIHSPLTISAAGVSGLSVPETMALAFIKRFVYAVAMLGAAWAAVGFTRSLAWCGGGILVGSCIGLLVDLRFARQEVDAKAEAHQHEHEMQSKIDAARRERNHAFEDHEHALKLLDEEKAKVAARDTLYFRERETARAALAEALDESRARDSVIANRDAEIAGLLAQLEILNKLGPAFTTALARAAHAGPMKLDDAIAEITGAVEEAELCAGMEARHGSHAPDIRGYMIAAGATAIAMAAGIDDTDDEEPTS